MIATRAKLPQRHAPPPQLTPVMFYLTLESLLLNPAPAEINA